MADGCWYTTWYIERYFINPLCVRLCLVALCSCLFNTYDHLLVLESVPFTEPNTDHKGGFSMLPEKKLEGARREPEEPGNLGKNECVKI